MMISSSTVEDDEARLLEQYGPRRTTAFSADTHHAAQSPPSPEPEGPLYDPSNPAYGPHGIYGRSVNVSEHVLHREAGSMAVFQGLAHSTTKLPHGYGTRTTYTKGTSSHPRVKEAFKWSATTHRSDDVTVVTAVSCGQWVNGECNGRVAERVSVVGGDWVDVAAGLTTSESDEVLATWNREGRCVGGAKTGVWVTTCLTSGEVVREEFDGSTGKRMGHPRVVVPPSVPALSLGAPSPFPAESDGHGYPEQSPPMSNRVRPTSTASRSPQFTAADAALVVADDAADHHRRLSVRETNRAERTMKLSQRPRSASRERPTPRSTKTAMHNDPFASPGGAKPQQQRGGSTGLPPKPTRGEVQTARHSSGTPRSSSTTPRDAFPTTRRLRPSSATRKPMTPRASTARYRPPQAAVVSANPAPSRPDAASLAQLALKAFHESHPTGGGHVGPEPYRLGQRVVAQISRGDVNGIVMYCGPLRHAPRGGPMASKRPDFVVGIATNDARCGAHNGTVGGFTYFVCEEGCGLLVPSSAVRGAHERQPFSY